jgi:hypothetical protein
MLKEKTCFDICRCYSDHMKKTHLIIVIHERHNSFIFCESGKALSTGSEPHDGTIMGCDAAIKRIGAIRPHNTVEYIFDIESGYLSRQACYSIIIAANNELSYFDTEALQDLSLADLRLEALRSQMKLKGVLS